MPQNKGPTTTSALTLDRLYKKFTRYNIERTSPRGMERNGVTLQSRMTNDVGCRAAVRKDGTVVNVGVFEERARRREKVTQYCVK